ncbi:MAG: CBS domain-containing protein [Elusimicrobia bacterium]|nr:CBS domain-containing protein [Elusimicrobiota bacterium]
MMAREVMRTRVTTARPDMTVRELAHLFVEHKISGVPVVDGHGRLVGVVSQTDLVRHELEPAESASDAPPAFYRELDGGLPRGYHAEAPDFTRVSDVMTPAVISGEEDMPVVELAKLMQKRRVHRVIITHHGELRGIVTSMDLLKVLVRMLGKGGG